MNRFLLLYFFFLVALYSPAQHNGFSFNRVSPPGGLNFQHIHSITQDAVGNIWMGSNQGVYKYNSSGFKRYNHNPNNPGSLRNDVVNQLLVDSCNKLWVATESGLDLFDNRHQSFIHFNYSYKGIQVENREVTGFAIDENNDFWIVDVHGFGRLDTISRQIEYINTDKLQSGAFMIYFDQAGNGWVGTNRGSIFKFNTQSKILTKVVDGPGSYPRTIYVEDDRLYVGYHSHGAWLFSVDGELIRHFEYSKEKKWDITNESVRSIFRDDQQNLWIGTYSGLFIEDEGELTRINTEHNESIPSYSIYSVFQDRSGGVWFGTWSGGLFYLDRKANNFQNHQKNQKAGSISNNIVSSFVQLEDGSMLVGTEGGGLNRFIPETGLFEHIGIGDRNDGINIKALSIDKNGTVWVGTYLHKLWFRKSGSDKYIQVNKDNFKGFPETVESVYALLPCLDGMWIGTYGNGVFFYEYASQRVLPLQEMIGTGDIGHLINVRSLYVDSRNNLWVGSNLGISRIRSGSGNEKMIVDFSRLLGPVYYINEMSDDQIWAGTKTMGIRTFISGRDAVEDAGADSFFPGNDVYGFVLDSENKIWVTTNTGLYLYDFERESIRLFNEIDGIQGKQFNPQAIYRDRSNTLYFGGTNGFTLVNPAEISKNIRPPEVIIEWISVNNESRIYPEFDVSTSSFAPLELGYDKTSFRVEFATDNYLLPGKNTYKYRLEGMYDDWIDNDTENSAVFTNIPPGDYVFEVKAANNDGVWNDSPTIIPITINLPWWRSSMAYIIYVFILSGIFVVIYRAKRDRINLKKTILIERIKREHDEHLHEAKLKFFTNISHEIRTPLTLIAGPLNNILQNERLSANASDKLNLIQRNTLRLLTLINQLLDFRSLGDDSQNLMLTKFNFGMFIDECYKYFEESAKEKNIRYRLITKKDFTVEADEEKLDKIIINVLSNAFKYTKQGGRIDIVADGNSEFPGDCFSHQVKFGELPEGDFLQVSIVDSGAGIDENSLHGVFDRFDKGAGREAGSGIGLSICKEFTLLHHGELIASSDPGKGTCVTIRLPLKQAGGQVSVKPRPTENVIPAEMKSAQINPLIHCKSDGEKYNILVVDDNDEMRQFINEILSPYYNVKESADGTQALNALRDNVYDLVLSDVMMPETDGFDLCNAIKSELEISHIPVILLTALSSEDNEIRGLSNGADDYISKPFNENVLISRIGNLIRQREELKLSFEHRFINNESIHSVGKMENDFLVKTNELIEANLTNVEFGVEQLSKEIGMSRGHLHRKMKQLTNYSPNEYIRLIRLKKAADLLKSDNYNIEEVVFRVGFNSASYFIKCFKVVYGQTPKQFVISNLTGVGKSGEL